MCLVKLGGGGCVRPRYEPLVVIDGYHSFGAIPTSLAGLPATCFFVSGVLKDEAKIEKMMNRCAKGQTLDQGELLQMQGLIYSYGQKIDLASKVVDKATSGLKQVMQTQV